MFKAFTAEGGIRLPLLVKLPGDMANSGTMNNAFLHVRDMMPTILDLALIDAGNTSTPAPQVSQVGYELFGMKAFISGPWKLLQLPEPFGTGDWQLYNLEKDPAEMTDLSAEFPDDRKKLIALWEQYRQDNGVLDISLDAANLLK